MIKKVSWIESPAFNWAGVAVSLVMLVLYVQQLMSPGHSSSTVRDRSVGGDLRGLAGYGGPQELVQQVVARAPAGRAAPVESVGTEANVVPSPFSTRAAPRTRRGSYPASSRIDLCIRPRRGDAARAPRSRVSSRGLPPPRENRQPLPAHPRA